MYQRLLLTASIVSVALPARATWSVVAVDPATREVGVAVATCVPEPNGTRILPQVAGLAPGLGALAAQAQFNQQTRDRALALLRQGMTPRAILDQVNASDSGSALRQYGIVTLSGGSANHTGMQNGAWAGAVENPVVSVQGNILVGPEVVADALAAFETTKPCEDALADKLLRALEAGAKRGGDSRCPSAQGALVAVLRVAAPGENGDSPALNLVVSSPRGSTSPVTLLKQAYERYRTEHPATMCSAGDAGAAVADAGASPRDAGREAGLAPVHERDAGGADTSAAPGAKPGATLDAGAAGPGRDADRDAGARSDASVGRPATNDEGSGQNDESDDEASEPEDEPGAEDDDAAPNAAKESGGCAALGARRGAGAAAYGFALLAVALFGRGLRARARGAAVSRCVAPFEAESDQS